MRSVLLLALFVLGPREDESHLNAFVDAVNSGDAVQLRQMMAKHFAPSMFAARKVDEWTKAFQEIGGQIAPVKVEKTLMDEPENVVVSLRTKTGETMGLRLYLDPKAPHLITGVRFSQNVMGLLETRTIVEIHDYKDLDDLAKKVREANRVPAIGIAVWRDGKIEAAADGLREIGKPAKVTANDRWLVGSIGKSMTSTLIARLIDMGKLNWDSKLGDLLKDVPMNPAYREVTVEQLMQHRGGMPQDLNFDGMTVAAIVGSLKDPAKIRAAYVKNILKRTPIGPRGTKSVYSNAGYTTLGHIAERIMKTPYETLMTRYVFEPIGMRSARVGMPGTAGQPGAAGQPHGHVPQADGKAKPQTLDGPLVPMGAPAGLGVSCTIGDLAKYAAWHMRGYNGEKIALKTATIRRLHTPLVKGETYADGWVVRREFHWHNGSDGTFRSEMAFWPKEKLVAVAIVNSGGEGDPSPSMQAMNAVYEKVKRR